MANDFDLINARAVQRERALHANAARELAHGEVGDEALLAFADDHAFEDLDSLLVAFDDLCVDADGISAAKIWDNTGLNPGQCIEFVRHRIGFLTGLNYPRIENDRLSAKVAGNPGHARDRSASRAPVPTGSPYGIRKFANFEEGDVGEAGDDELGDAVAVANDVFDVRREGIESDHDLTAVVGIERAEGGEDALAGESAAGAKLGIEARRHLHREARGYERRPLGERDIGVYAGVDVEAGCERRGAVGQPGSFSSVVFDSTDTDDSSVFEATAKFDTFSKSCALLSFASFCSSFFNCNEFRLISANCLAVGSGKLFAPRTVESISLPVISSLTGAWFLDSSNEPTGGTSLPF